MAISIEYQYDEEIFKSVDKFIKLLKDNGVKGPYWLETMNHKVYIFEKDAIFTYGKKALDRL